MVAIPKNTGTVAIMDEKVTEGYGRPYLGMSGTGKECWRQLWYGFHWVSKDSINARSQRIFDVGHLFEQIAIKELKEAGCKVFLVDKNGDFKEMFGLPEEEQEELVGFAEHVFGHPDGRIIGLAEFPKVECLLELKTMKQSKFTAFKKKGIQIANPVYYAQAQRYMSEMALSMCFFLAINKDTCEYHHEFVEYDFEFAKELIRKEQIIIMSSEPPERHYSSNNYNCGWCNHYSHCHAKQEPDKNCRTCDFSDLENDSVWSCQKLELKISVAVQRVGCDQWKKGWGL